jgi:hypothetical protein
VLGALALAACGSKSADAPVQPPAPNHDANAAPPTTEVASREQPASKPAAPTPAEARKEALDQAKNAGILGTLAAEQYGALDSITGTGDIGSGFDDANVYGGLLGDEVGEMKGGFGSGFGEGGGGTGWGTIGTGRYGTIGHGSGTGSGYGTGSGGMGKGGGSPAASIGTPTVTGDLDKDIIRRYVRRKLPHIRYCYEKALLADPALEGTVRVSFVITQTGQAQNASATGLGDSVSGCVARLIETIQFPKPKGGGIVHVSYPFTFRPPSPK